MIGTCCSRFLRMNAIIRNTNLFKRLKIVYLKLEWVKILTVDE